MTAVDGHGADEADSSHVTATRTMALAGQPADRPDVDSRGVEDDQAPQPHDAADADELLVCGRRPLSRARRRGLGAMIVLLAAVATATWFLTRPEPAFVVTYTGSTVDNTTEVLARTDAALVRYARDHHGALSPDSRCYFDRIGGSVDTDVAATLFCGPVLFHGGAAPAMYLRYALSSSGTSVSGHTRLGVEDRPERAEPDRLPDGAHLERPDGRRMPDGADGLVAPRAPPAGHDTLVRVSNADLPELPAAPDTAIIRSRNFQVRLRAGGVVSEYGRGIDARCAPPGEKLLAFRLQMAAGEVSGVYLAAPRENSAVGLAVDGGAARQLPIPFYIWFGPRSSLGWYVVAAVPVDARRVDLVVSDAGVRQRLSVPDGSPGSHNIAILAGNGDGRDGRASYSRTALAHVGKAGRTFSTHLRMGVQPPHLGYFSPYGPEHASGPDRALLRVNIYCYLPQLGQVVAFTAGNLTLVPAGGHPIRASDLTNAGYPVFDVPAAFRSGTVIVTGATALEGWTVTLPRPYRVNITFP